MNSGGGGARAAALLELSAMSNDLIALIQVSIFTSFEKAVHRIGVKMIIHIVLLTFHNQLSDAQARDVFNGFSKLPSLIPQIKSYRFGPDLAEKPTNADYAIVGEFINMEEFRTYRDHPAQIEFAKSIMSPLLKEMRAIQFETDARV